MKTINVGIQLCKTEHKTVQIPIFQTFIRWSYNFKTPKENGVRKML